MHLVGWFIWIYDDARTYKTLKLPLFYFLGIFARTFLHQRRDSVAGIRSDASSYSLWILLPCQKNYIPVVSCYNSADCKVRVSKKREGMGRLGRGKAFFSRQGWNLASLSPLEMWWHTVTQGGKWRENWRIELVASTLHTTSEHGVSSITTADAHTSAASSRLNWRSPPI
jgi:hypothetical protein